eukprot:3154651-Alexandrium_andersonii.AAC.1
MLADHRSEPRVSQRTAAPHALQCLKGRPTAARSQDFAGVALGPHDARFWAAPSDLLVRCCCASGAAPQERAASEARI